MSLKTIEEFRFRLGFTQPVTARRACDGPSRLRRSVLLLRHSVQRLNFSEKSVMVRHTCDGPSFHSITKFRESIFSTQFQIFYVF